MTSPGSRSWTARRSGTSGPDPGEVGPQESIGGPKRDVPSRALALEDEELMARGEHLGLERGSAAERGPERCEDGQKGGDHRRSSLGQVRETLNDDGPDQFLGRHRGRRRKGSLGRERPQANSCGQDSIRLKSLAGPRSRSALASRPPMIKNPASIPAAVAAYGEDGARRSWLHTRGPVRRIDTLRTLAIGSALILAIGTTACASDEENDEKSEPATVDATMSTEASEGTAASLAGSSRVWYRTVEIDGQTIFYREAGSPDAPTLLLLHGFPTSSPRQ